MAGKGEESTPARTYDEKGRTHIARPSSTQPIELRVAAVHESKKLHQAPLTGWLFSCPESREVNCFSAEVSHLILWHPRRSGASHEEAGVHFAWWCGSRVAACRHRYAEGDQERLPLLANELVRLKPDVIVTGSTEAVFAAKQATAAIPIVSTALTDPVAFGLVESQA